MAVSGRKQTDMQGSIARGSAEDFDYKCEPCLTKGQHIEAHGFCVPCQEYHCKTCQDCHTRTKALRNHQILGRDEFDKVPTIRKTYNECTEQCQLHQKEIIKFYCTTHSVLGCNNCMTMDHRNCEIHYIPEKCVGVADGKEYKDIMAKLSEKLKEAEEVSEKAEYSNCEVNDVNKEVIKKISEFRAEINDRLDQMQQSVLSLVEGKKSNNKEFVQKAIDTYEKIIANVKKLQSSLRVNKSNNQNGQLYIDIKRAESALKSDELTEAKEQIMNMNIQYSFRRSADLENLLSKEIVFGELLNHSQYGFIKKKKKTIDHLTLKKTINVKTESDNVNCDITGCAVLPPNKIVLADYNNHKVKVVSVENKLVLQEKSLDSEPLDIAVISHHQFAVTMPYISRIDVMTTDEKLSRVRSIQVEGNCGGIAFHEDSLYVFCLNPPRAVVMTTQGNELKNIQLNFLSSFYTYIAVRMDTDLLYISDYFNNTVVSVSLQGNVSTVYKHENLKRPQGMCSLDDGSLLVCNFHGLNIHQVKDDLKEGKTIYKDSIDPKSICYCPQNNEVYVGCYGDQLKVLSLEFKVHYWLS